MKSTWFGCPRRYDFARCLREADYGWRHWELFSSFLTMCSYSLRQGVFKMRNGAMSDDFEERVLREQGRLPKWSKFAEAMGILTVALEDEPYDFLGTLMMEMGVNDVSYRGQCFTPRQVTAVVAEMLLFDAEPDDSRTMLMQEPCCGGGAMIIATSKIMQGKGFYPWHYHWHAIDVDAKCFMITYIQCSLLGLPVTVHHGNTLTLEMWDSATTLIGMLHPPKTAKPIETVEVLPVNSTVDAVPIRQLEMFN